MNFCAGRRPRHAHNLMPSGPRYTWRRRTRAVDSKRLAVFTWMFSGCVFFRVSTSPPDLSAWVQWYQWTQPGAAWAQACPREAAGPSKPAQTRAQPRCPQRQCSTVLWLDCSYCSAVRLLPVAHQGAPLPTTAGSAERRVYLWMVPHVPTLAHGEAKACLRGSFRDRFQARFPPGVAHRLLLTAPIAAIE